MVTIFINSPTFDLMTKDAKTTFMDQLAVIGGTLGLFAGFSIISGIEVRLLSWDTTILSPIRSYTSWSRMSLWCLRCQRRARTHQEETKTSQEKKLQIDMLHSSKCLYISWINKLECIADSAIQKQCCCTFYASRNFTPYLYLNLEKQKHNPQ